MQVDTTFLCQTMAEERIQTLRLELKAWEKQHSVQHGGKPSREDIKNNVEIGMQARDLESTVPY
jgi:DNA replication regulator SLD2